LRPAKSADDLWRHQNNRMRSQANSVRSRGILRAVPSGLEADDPQALRLFSTTCGSHDENKEHRDAHPYMPRLFFNSL